MIYVPADPENAWDVSRCRVSAWQQTSSSPQENFRSLSGKVRRANRSRGAQKAKVVLVRDFADLTDVTVDQREEVRERQPTGRLYRRKPVRARLAEETEQLSFRRHQKNGKHMSNNAKLRGINI
ncbi:hypothetical protein TNCV_1563851 [Trichonephila clavipes]|nr:hypothetical protein TNCV_1563851 [Trichonephila clavipes]